MVRSEAGGAYVWGMRLFFYGTMLDPEVRRIVLGDGVERLTIRPAVLVGYRRVRAKDGDDPVLVRRTAGRVHGALVEGLRPDDLHRIAHFEGPDYAPRRATVIDKADRRVCVWVMISRGARQASGEAWDLRRWQIRAKSRLLPQLRRWMLEYRLLKGYSVDIPWPVRRMLKSEAGPQETAGYTKGP